RVACEDRLGIRAAARIAALRALDPRQEPLDAVHRVVFPVRQQTRRRDQRRRERERKAGEKRERDEHQSRANPAKPRNASDMIPAVTKAIAWPRKGFGTSARSSRSRSPPSIASTRPKPSAAPAP